MKTFELYLDIRATKWTNRFNLCNLKTNKVIYIDNNGSELCNRLAQRTKNGIVELTIDEIKYLFSIRANHIVK